MHEDGAVRAVQPDIDVAVAAASAGAAVVRAAYGAVHVRHAKSGTDFATEADLEAEAAILGVIRAARPDDGRRAGYLTDGVVTDNVHFAAGIALCRNAGCVVTDLAGQPLDSGRGLVAVADAETHRRLVDLVGPYLATVD